MKTKSSMQEILSVFLVFLVAVIGVVILSSQIKPNNMSEKSSASAAASGQVIKSNNWLPMSNESQKEWKTAVGKNDSRYEKYNPIAYQVIHSNIVFRCEVHHSRRQILVFNKSGNTYNLISTQKESNKDYYEF